MLRAEWTFITKHVSAYSTYAEQTLKAAKRYSAALFSYKYLDSDDIKNKNNWNHANQYDDTAQEEILLTLQPASASL